MKLLLTRYLDGSDRTFGTLWLQESSIISGECYPMSNDPKISMKLTEICSTMEPRRRDLSREKKVKGQTAMPSGTYEIKFSPSAKFNRMMPYLVNVPQFEGIMFHPGNTLKDTAGCILVGERCNNGLTRSKHHFEQLMQLLKEHKDEAMVIEIIEIASPPAPLQRERGVNS